MMDSPCNVMPGCATQEFKVRDQYGFATHWTCRGQMQPESGDRPDPLDLHQIWCWDVTIVAMTTVPLSTFQQMLQACSAGANNVTLLVTTLVTTKRGVCLLQVLQNDFATWSTILKEHPAQERESARRRACYLDNIDSLVAAEDLITAGSHIQRALQVSSCCSAQHPCGAAVSQYASVPIEYNAQQTRSPA